MYVAKEVFMLCDFRTGKPVTMSKERREELHGIESLVEPEQWVSMRERIRRWANEIGNETTDFFASNWMTGRNWEQFEHGIFSHYT